MALSIQTTIYKVIYVLEDDNHPDLLKVGKTEAEAYDFRDLTPDCNVLREAVIKCYKSSGRLAIENIHIKYTEVACFLNENGVETRFDDTDVHKVLDNSGWINVPIKTEFGTATEWYKIDLQTAKNAIAAVKNGQCKINGPIIIPPKYPTIVFREEQEKAIDSTLQHFQEVDEGKDRKMLWNAKMRFGKTLCALELINRLDVQKVMILTHRPTVRSGWFDDYHLIKFNKDWQYGSKNGKKYAILNDKNDHPEDFITGKDLKTLQEEFKSNGTRYIYFASMQDLRGQKVTRDENGKVTKREWKDNNQDVYETNWDLIIFDEAHEGTQTTLGKEVIDGLTCENNPLKLFLSGTPFNILSQFEKEEIFTWDYVMEQKAKNEWAEKHPKQDNPYEGLAKLNIYTYNLGEVFQNNPDYIKKSEDDYFNFSEFFRTFNGNKEEDGFDMPEGASKGDFVHEKDVIAFLDLLRQSKPQSQYPYSNEAFRKALSHTLWMVPGVSQAARLEYLINRHPLHIEDGYEVINVAGEGKALENLDPDEASKIDKKEKDALKKVQKALKDPSIKRTITLSCGKLTTGVSVPEWTGVFMLSGGYSTGAANYMQTIFRGQTPYKNGAIKKNCYAFDFAPDRTLTVIDDYIKMQPLSRNGDTRKHGDRVRTVQDYLRFCPVIGMKGGEEVEYNALAFIKKVNQAYDDHIISHGFKSKHLFKNMALFTPADHALLAKVENLIGGSKVIIKSDGTIDMASNDLKGDKNKKRKGKSETSKKSNKKENKNTKKNPTKKQEQDQRKKSQRVLDAIFVRFPLLLFGSVEDADKLTIEDLLSEEVIDSESWEEFMPKGFTKPIFRQISHLVDVDNLISSTSVIINRAKNADLKPIQERIIEIADMISKFHFPDKETVLTPLRVVNKHMIDTLGGYNLFKKDDKTLLATPELLEGKDDITSQIFCNQETKILEINSKSGVYPLWIAHTLWHLLGKENMSNEEEWELWKRILENNLYTVCKTKMAEKITKRVLCGYKDNIRLNIVSYEDIIERIKDSKRKAQLIEDLRNPTTYSNNSNTSMINFDAIVGNPPYQIADKGDGADDAAAPIYPKFVELAQALAPRYISIIMPSKWMVGGRSTLKGFRKTMKNDSDIIYIKDYEDDQKIFPNAHNDGGICYVLWNLEENKKKSLKYYFENYDGEIIENNTLRNRFSDYVIRDSRIIPILDKLFVNGTVPFDQIVSKTKPFGVRKDLFNSPEKYPLANTQDEEFPNSVHIYGVKGKKGGARRTDAYIDKCIISDSYDALDKSKIFFTTSYSTNATVPPEHIKGSANDCCTETFLLIGPFDSPEEMESCSSYIDTDIFRFLLYYGHGTMQVNKQVFSLIPKIPFNKRWDNDHIYKEFGIEEYKDFIDKTLKKNSSKTTEEINNE